MADLPKQTLDWLLEPDGKNPGVRFFALRDLLGRPPGDSELVAAQNKVMTSGPVPKILQAQNSEGYWQKPGPGYATKYRGTVWQLIQLERLGADPRDERVQSACRYVLEHSQAESGGFSASGVAGERRPPTSYVIHCLNGNLLAALLTFGWLHDERVQRAIDWETGAVTGEDAEFRFYKTGTTGPGFACGSNAGLPCAWGANKAVRALLLIPPADRSEAVNRVLSLSAKFLLSHDPGVADYPFKRRISDNWGHLGLPLSYWSDFLETLENLTALGYGEDARLDHAFALLLAKRDGDGLWQLENTINGRTLVSIETRNAPSKWVTLRALRVLRQAGRLPD